MKGRVVRLASSSNQRLAWFLAGGLLVALVLAGVVSNFASGSPDGLDATARKGCTTDAEGNITGGTCIAQQEGEHQLKDSPLADYGIAGIDNPYLSTGLAGVTGVLLTFGLGYGLFWLARRRGQGPDESGDRDASDRDTSDRDASDREASDRDASDRGVASDRAVAGAGEA